MKIIFNLILLFLFAIGVFAQQNANSNDLLTNSINTRSANVNFDRFGIVQKQSLDSVLTNNVNYLTNDTISKLKFVFDYDEFGRIIKEIRLSDENLDRLYDTAQIIVFNYIGISDFCEKLYYNFNAELGYFTPSIKIEYNYNDNGLIVSAKRFSWKNESQEWSLDIEFKSDYDLHHNQTLIKNINYSTTGDTIGGFTENYSFDTYNNILSKLEARYKVESHSWKPFRQTTYSYFDEVRLLNKKQEMFDLESDTWILNYSILNSYEGVYLKDSIYEYLSSGELLTGYKYTFEYNNELCISTTRYSLNNDEELVIVSKITYAYDANGNLTEEIAYNYNMLAEWIPTQKIVKEYNPENLCSIYKSFNWDNIENDWKNVNKTDFEYDEQQNLILQTDYLFENSNSEWFGNSKNEYEYDLSENLIKHYSFTWDSANSLWLTNIFFDRVYNENFEISDLVLPEDFIEFELFTGMILKNYGSLYGDINFTEDYFYSNKSFEDEVEIETSDLLSVFPNPCTNYIMLAGDILTEKVNIIIYDLNGKCVVSTYAAIGEEIELSRLSGGVYSYKILNGNKISCGKIVKH